ncbi:NADPH:quinone oxidoreductase family protein [Piscinibacterium candidicorallinum]|uniref:NADPH:quinone oxidoreductase family protein n=1 Tax=Piscinibacterium candidicorallinum TaxID=1793872 RepID=A0ABV7GZY8_9BURK
MRAVICSQWGGPELLEVKDVPDPVAGAGEVLIDIQAAGVNFPDVLIIQKKYQMQPPLPFTPGAEIAGVVRAVGEGVSHVKPGDSVIAFAGLGGFAQAVSVKAELVMPMPPGVPFELAAAFSLAYGTSWHAVRDRAALKAGETMLVLGAAGGVGLAAVEIGKAIGARVIACAGSDEKLAVCRQHGADETINYDSEDLRERIKALTGGKGPDVIYDAVGGKYAEPAFRSMAWRGRYLVVGFAAGDIPNLPLNLPLLKGASLVGVFWGEFAKREPKANLAGMMEMMGWMREGKLKPLISKTYSLDEAPQALADMAARKVVGKIVIKP